LYSSINITTTKKSRWMRKTGNVARMTEMRNAFRILIGKPRKLLTAWEKQIQTGGRS
jgi:hypothetical protein